VEIDSSLGGRGSLSSEGCTSYLDSAWEEEINVRLDADGVAVTGEALAVSAGDMFNTPVHPLGTSNLLSFSNQRVRCVNATSQLQRTKQTPWPLVR
jgi:hypothetical protein